MDYAHLDQPIQVGSIRAVRTQTECDDVVEAYSDRDEQTVAERDWGPE